MTPASVSIHRSCLSSVYILVLPFFFISLAQTSAGYRGTVHINTTLTGLDRLIQNHRAICRLSDSCATMDKTDPLRTCCKPCSCEMSCFAERTCCPEVLTEFWEEPEAEIKPECMKPAFRIPSDAVYYSIDSAFMISKCPDDFDDKGIKEKCERRNGNALEDQLPVTVTDNDRTVTFANKYCAECHLVPKEKLINWIVRVECKESTFNFWSKASLLADVEATNDCYLVFQPISSDHHKKCFNGISKCNITGEWKIYDNFTDRACQLYTAPFLEYINPFCAVCNGLDANRMAQYEMADCSAGRRPPMNWVPFSALISMDSLVMADSNEHVAKRKNFAKRDNCSQNQIYDAYVVSNLRS